MHALTADVFFRDPAALSYVQHAETKTLETDDQMMSDRNVTQRSIPHHPFKEICGLRHSKYVDLTTRDSYRGVLSGGYMPRFQV